MARREDKESLEKLSKLSNRDKFIVYSEEWMGKKIPCHGDILRVDLVDDNRESNTDGARSPDRVITAFEVEGNKSYRVSVYLKGGDKKALISEYGKSGADSYEVKAVERVK